MFFNVINNINLIIRNVHFSCGQKWRDFDRQTLGDILCAVMGRLKKISFVFAVSGLVFGAGCSLNVGEKKKDSSAMQVGSEELTCLSQVGEKIEGYFGAKMEIEETKSFFQCVETSFDLFQQYTKGADTDSYSADEVRRFLEEKFLYPKKISDDFLLAAMQLKQVLLGGSVDTITHGEFERLKTVLRALSEASVLMEPYMAALNSQVAAQKYPDPRERAQRIKEARVAITRMAQLVGDRIGRFSQPYKLENLGAFLTELTRFIYGDGDKVVRAQHWSQLITRMAPILTGGMSEALEPGQWTDLVDSAFGWYVLVQRFPVELLFTGGVWQGFGLTTFDEVMNDSFHLIREALSRQKNGEISFSALENLFSSLRSLDLLPPVWSSQIVREVLPLIGKILGDVQVNPSQRQAQGVSLPMVAAAESEFFSWSEVQKQLVDSFPVDSSDKGRAATGGKIGQILDEGLAPSLGQKNSMDRTFSLGGSNWTLTPEMISRELETISKKVRPLFRSLDVRTYLVYANEVDKYEIQGFYNLSLMNVLKAVVRLAARGYSADPERAISMKGLTGDELNSLVGDCFDLALHLKEVDPRDRKILGSLFMLVGKQFTYAGGGLKAFPSVQKGNLANANLTGVEPNLLEFPEAIELISSILSTAKMTEGLYQEASSRCEHGGKDYFDLSKMDRKCFFEIFENHLDQWLVEMPQMRAYWNHLPQSERSQFTRILARIAARPMVKEEEYVKATEKILGTTRPLEECGFFGYQCRRKNRERLEALTQAIAATNEAGMNSEFCSWSEGKDLPPGYCDWIEFGEISKMTGIMHYVETILTRFDLDQDGRITTGEAWEAFENFRGLIDTVLKEQDRAHGEQDLREAYAFVLINGKILGKHEWAPIGFAYDAKLGDFNFNVDRLSLLKVFEVLYGGATLPQHVATELRNYRAKTSGEYAIPDNVKDFELDGP